MKPKASQPTAARSYVSAREELAATGKARPPQNKSRRQWRTDAPSLVEPISESGARAGAALRRARVPRLLGPLGTPAVAELGEVEPARIGVFMLSLWRIAEHHDIAGQMIGAGSSPACLERLKAAQRCAGLESVPLGVLLTLCVPAATLFPRGRGVESLGFLASLLNGRLPAGEDSAVTFIFQTALESLRSLKLDAPEIIAAAIGGGSGKTRPRRKSPAEKRRKEQRKQAAQAKAAEVRRAARSVLRLANLLEGRVEIPLRTARGKKRGL